MPVIGLVAYGRVAQRRRNRAQEQGFQRLGFTSCPEKREWLEEVVIAIENTRGYRYEVWNPKWCAIAGVGVGSQVPFRPDEIIARMRALA